MYDHFITYTSLLVADKLISTAGQAIKDQLLELELLRSGLSTSTTTAPEITGFATGASSIPSLSNGDQYHTSENSLLNWFDDDKTLPATQDPPIQQRGTIEAIHPEHSAREHWPAASSIPEIETALPWVHTCDRQSTTTPFDAHSVASHDLQMTLSNTDDSFTRLPRRSPSSKSSPQQNPASTTQRLSGPQPALHLAAAGGNVTCVQTLLSYQADPDLADEQGMTPLHACAASAESSVDHASITTMLINAGADTLARDGEGRTPLQVAAIKGNVMVLSTLLSCGVSI